MYADEAPYNSYSKQHESDCLPDTRVDLLQEIYRWADGQDKQCIFWLNGLAGTGKSTIARTVAHEYNKQKQLGASFFFSRGGGDVSHAGKFVTSIAAQLAYNVPASRQRICGAIEEHSKIISQSLREQWHQLVLTPLSHLDGNDCPPKYVLVVDALDECDGDNDVRIIIQLLAEAQTLKRVRLRVLLTSRPEIPIRSGFYQMSDEQHQDYVLHNISQSTINHDIRVYLEYKLETIRVECYLSAGWPGNKDIARLVQNAGGLFIWAATACRYIHEGGQFAADRLGVILKDNNSLDQFSADSSSTDDSSDDSSAIRPEEQLNTIYLMVLRGTVRKYKKQERKKWYKLVRETLGAVVLLFSPLSALSLARLLHVPKENIDGTLRDLHSIIDVPQDHIRPLRLHHPSFRDFLINKDKCDDLNFWVEETQAHQQLANSCIQLMTISLKRDVCGVGSPGTLVGDIENAQVEQCLSPELQYACLHWIQHLCQGGVCLSNRGDDPVFQFLKNHFLHWLEALSWIRKVPEGIYAIVSLESIARVSLP